VASEIAAEARRKNAERTVRCMTYSLLSVVVDARDVSAESLRIGESSAAAAYRPAAILRYA
jgi:hypothetical protein